VHLVLGSQRIDLRDRTVVVAMVDGAPVAVPGADVVWARSSCCDRDRVVAAGLPVGTDAADAADVERLARAGVAVVALGSLDEEAIAVAAARDLSVLLPARPVSGDIDAARVLVEACTPVADAAACCTVTGTGPPAWARAVGAVAAGVRVVRTSDARSVRRAVTVADRLVAARKRTAT
jgi:hypothetical protein